MGHDTLRIRAKGVDHVVVHVEDVSRAKRFYVDLLGMEVAHEHDGRVFLRCGQQQVGLFEGRRKPDGSGRGDLNHIALRVESGSYDEVKATLEAAGVAVSGRRGDPRCIYFRDPDGHQLQILPLDR